MKPKVEPGERLRQLRVKRKVSQASLADAIFVKNTTISNWEKGTRKIQTDNLKSLSDFFGVPVSYFLEAEEKTESWRRVPIKALLAGSAAVAMLVSLTVVALNGRTNLNNEACYGELVCYLIEDPSIASELSSRNISGGLMTNVEMDKLKTFLETYTPGSEAHRFNYQKMQEIFTKNYYLNFPSENVEIITNLEGLVNDFYNPNQPSPFPNLTVFNLDLTNPETNQLFYTGSGFNLEKHVIYKVSSDVFKYEIYSTQEYVFNIQLELNTIYFGEKSYISPMVIYDYFLDNYPFENIFNPNPLLFQNDSSHMEVDLIQTIDGNYLFQKGVYYYMKGDPLYELDVPFMSINFSPKYSSKIYYISAGYNGGYGAFKPYFNFWIYDYGFTNLLQPLSGNSLSYTLNEEIIGQPLNLQDWFDWSNSREVDSSQLDGMTSEELRAEILEIFNLFLNDSFTLDAIVN